MTGAELLDDLKAKLGNTNLGLTNAQLYRNLNESKKWHERNTNISFKGDVGIKCDAGDGSIGLTASTIDLDEDHSLITIVNDSLIYDDNWDGRGVPPFIEKTSTQHIRLLRNTNDISGEPTLYALHRVISGGTGVLTLELYYAVQEAQTDFDTSKLRCDIKQMSPEISEDTAGDDLLVPDYAEQAISYYAAKNVLMSLRSQNWMNMGISWSIEMKTVRKLSNEMCTGGIRQRLAQ